MFYYRTKLSLREEVVVPTYWREIEAKVSRSRTHIQWLTQLGVTHPTWPSLQTLSLLLFSAKTFCGIGAPQSASNMVKQLPWLSSYISKHAYPIFMIHTFLNINFFSSIYGQRHASRDLQLRFRTVEKYLFKNIK